MEKILKQLGFSENEVKIYLAALELGRGTVQEIAKNAGVKRTTAYSVLDDLVQRGLIGKSMHRGKVMHVAEPPDKLLSLTQNIFNSIKKALPEMEAIYNKSDVKPKIVFFEGKEAIQNVYDDTLREKPAEILEWNTSAYFERFPPNHAYIDKRVNLNIHAKRIAGEGSIWQTKHKGYDQSELSETVIVPKDKFWPMIEVNIYNNKVAFMNYADEMSVIIENKAIADAMKRVYELSWQGAKSLEVDKKT